MLDILAEISNEDTRKVIGTICAAEFQKIAGDSGVAHSVTGK